ncbi:MAG: arginine repressor [Pyrinomonadaceae bacterium]
MNKAQRQGAMLQIIGANHVRRQDELLRLLTERGFNVTQASVSRDLDELGISKLGGIYAQNHINERERGIFGAVSIAKSGSCLLVARCSSGLASAAAVRIDAARVDGIVGTIAGDDTIFIAVENGGIQTRVRKSLESLFGLNG